MANGGETRLDNAPRDNSLLGTKLAIKKPPLANGGERGAGRSRTDDGGFAIRSHAPKLPRKTLIFPSAQRWAQQLVQRFSPLRPPEVSLPTCPR
jgi:hypothetical protein